jgi:hypothetical protein
MHRAGKLSAAISLVALVRSVVAEVLQVAVSGRANVNVAAFAYALASTVHLPISCLLWC